MGPLACLPKYPMLLLSGFSMALKFRQIALKSSNRVDILHCCLKRTGFFARKARLEGMIHLYYCPERKIYQPYSEQKKGAEKPILFFFKRDCALGSYKGSALYDKKVITLSVGSFFKDIGNTLMVQHITFVASGSISF